MLLPSIRVYPGTVTKIAKPILQTAALITKVQFHLQKVYLKNLTQQTLLLSKLQLPAGLALLPLSVSFLLLPVHQMASVRRSSMILHRDLLPCQKEGADPV